MNSLSQGTALSDLHQMNPDDLPSHPTPLPLGFHLGLLNWHVPQFFALLSCPPKQSYLRNIHPPMGKCLPWPVWNVSPNPHIDPREVGGGPGEVGDTSPGPEQRAM